MFEIYKDILEQYKYTLGDYIYILKTYLVNNIDGKLIFKDNEKINNLLKEEVTNYLNSCKNECKIYNFLLKNERRLYEDDIYGLLNILIDEFKEKNRYIEELFDNFDTALSMNLDYKFYAPRNKPNYIKDYDIEKYKSYAKGYNIERIYDFLEEYEVCDQNFIDKSDIKTINVDAKENIDIFGVYQNNKIIIPIIKDELSTLITIHELIHLILLKNKEIIKDEKIIHGEDIPIFYELLFQETNYFSEEKIHTTEIANELLKTYNGEPLEKQIEKVKKMI